MSDPTELPPLGGQTELLLVHVLSGLQVTVPALDVSVTLSDDAGMPTAYADIVVASCPTVIAQPLVAQPAPRVAAERDAAFTACARL